MILLNIPIKKVVGYLKEKSARANGNSVERKNSRELLMISGLTRIQWYQWCLYSDNIINYEGGNIVPFELGKSKYDEF